MIVRFRALTAESPPSRLFKYRRIVVLPYGIMLPPPQREASPMPSVTMKLPCSFAQQIGAPARWYPSEPICQEFGRLAGVGNPVETDRAAGNAALGLRHRQPAARRALRLRRQCRLSRLATTVCIDARSPCTAAPAMPTKTGSKAWASMSFTPAMRGWHDSGFRFDLLTPALFSGGIHYPSPGPPPRVEAPPPSAEPTRPPSRPAKPTYVTR